MTQQPVTVTGAAGFIGRHLVDTLAKRGYFVRAVDHIPQLPRETANEHVELVTADLRSPDAAKAVIGGSGDCIALAAQSAGLGYFNRHPASMLHDNCLIAAHTFAAARQSSLERVIYVSSSCVLDRAASLVATESLVEMAPAPSPGYPFSKLLGEALCRAYATEFGLGFTILRPFNVYGPGERAKVEWGDAHVIPDLVGKVLSGVRPVPIFGTGKQTRSFTHVTDIVAGIISALERPDDTRNEDFNLGMPEETSIENLLNTIWGLTGHEGQAPIEHRPSFLVDPPRRAVDIAKARKLLKWAPTIALREGLADYISWYRLAVLDRGRRGDELS